MDMVTWLQQIDGKLDQVLAKIAQGGIAAPPVEQIPDGMVAVRPNGVHGVGKVRFWPALATDGKVTEGPWSYGERMSKTPDPTTGQPFYPFPGRYGIIGGTCSARGLTIPEACDFLAHPDDWYTQAELDRQAMEKERDAGASWVSQ